MLPDKVLLVGIIKKENKDLNHLILSPERFTNNMMRFLISLSIRLQTHRLNHLMLK
jgi:hypothetical protein